MAKSTKTQRITKTTSKTARAERGRKADEQTAAAAAATEANEKTKPAAVGELTTAPAPTDASAAPAEARDAEAETAEQATAADARKGPAPKKARTRARPNKARGVPKKDRLVQLLRREDGATIEELMAEFGWQAHTCRGAISIAAKQLGVVAERVEKGRYRMPPA